MSEKLCYFNFFDTFHNFIYLCLVTFLSNRRFLAEDISSPKMEDIVKKLSVIYSGIILILV